jgi:hypothetical protein
MYANVICHAELSSFMDDSRIFIPQRNIFKTEKISKNYESFSKNMVVGSKFLSISPWKSAHVAKSHIYSERGHFGASSYVKNSISIFFRKIDFSEGGPPSTK